jgi:hypothetical protein
MLNDVGLRKWHNFAVDSQESQRLVPVTDRLPADLLEFLNRLASYQGTTRQEVHARIIELFREAIGPIPDKKDLLGSWPGQPPKLKKPRK